MRLTNREGYMQNRLQRKRALEGGEQGFVFGRQRQ